MQVDKGDRVVFIGPKKIPYCGIVQRVNGQWVTVKATGMVPTPITVVSPIAPGTLHIVHADGVVKT